MLTLQDVKKIAKLANINISDEEAIKYQKQLSSILDYVDMLNKVDTSDVVPTFHSTGEVKNVFSTDNKPNSNNINKIDALKNASQSNKDYFLTKAVL